jgi:hypothetical protein
MTKSDAVAEELATARRELHEQLLLALDYMRLRAGDDELATIIDRRVTAAFDRLRMSSTRPTPRWRRAVDRALAARRLRRALGREVTAKDVVDASGRGRT